MTTKDCDKLKAMNESSASQSKSAPSEPEVDFGYRRVPEHAKEGLVGQVFSRVASRYDLMNDAMSLGLHRWWKHEVVRWANLQPGWQVADIAAGTGDITLRILPRIMPGGHVWMCDLNPDMLSLGRDRMVDAGWIDAVSVSVCNAEALPMADASLDAVFCAFGLRNMTHQDRVLREFRRVLKPGGRAWVLEFSQPDSGCFQTLYDHYSMHWIPRLGEWLAGDRESYQYLVESIRRHPDALTLQSLFVAQGFGDCQVHRLFKGMVVVHEGIVC